MSKACFVISPIGADESETRRRSDQVLRHIIQPAVNLCGYDAVRADQISDPGLITSQIIQHVINDDLVIADLTGHNPNVFYELALRHAARKPVVQLMALGEVLPFDVAAARTVFVNHTDLDSAERARDAIVSQIRAVERNPADVDSPIALALQLKLLADSDKPVEQTTAAILTAVHEVQGLLREQRSPESRSGAIVPLMQELALWAAQAWRMTSRTGLDQEQIAEVHDHLRSLAPLVRVMCADAGVSPPDLGRRGE